MTSIESDNETDAAADVDASLHRRRHYRVAGVAGIGAFAAWLAQPVLVSIFSPLVPENGPDYAYILSTPFNGVIEATVFTGIGVALLFMVTAIGSLVQPTSTAARIGHTMGIVGSVAWFLSAGGALALYTSVGWWLGAAAPDQALQQALYQSLAVGTTGHILLYAIGMIGWLIMLATAGRRAGAVGWPLSIVALVAAAAMVVTAWIPFAPPFGSISALAASLILGIAFLVKSRRPRTAP